MSFRVRIVRVRPKRGQKVELLRVPKSEDRSKILREDVGRFISTMPAEIAGFAIMMWDMDLNTNGKIRVWDNPIPSILVPDLVRNWLLAKQAEDWTVERLMNP